MCGFIKPEQDPDEKKALLFVSNIRSNVTGPIVIATYGTYTAGIYGGAIIPLVADTAVAAQTACITNPATCTMVAVDSAEAIAGIATGATTVGVGAVQSRINLARGATRYSPLRSTGNAVSAGFDHVLAGHFNRPLASNRSIFTIKPDDLRNILQSDKVVGSPAVKVQDGMYRRVVDVGRTIGNTSLNHGGGSTRWIEIFTDRAGNLITTYPVPRSK